MDILFEAEDNATPITEEETHGLKQKWIRKCSDQCGAGLEPTVRPNGNGRISRLMADLLIRQIGGTALFWGSIDLVSISATRTQYIKALQKADSGDYSELLEFTSGPVL